MVTASDSGGKAKRGQNGGGRTPVDSKTRARVLKLARQGLSRNEVARRVKLSTSTVSRICSSATPPVRFDRRAIAIAIEARTVDLKAARATEAQAIIGIAAELRRRLFLEREQRTTDGNGTVVTYMLEPGAREWKDTLTAYGIALDKHLVLVKADSDERDLPALDQWLEHLAPGA